MPEQRVILERECNYIYSLTLSPGERYVQMLDKIDTNEGKTTLIDLDTLKVAAEYL